MAFESQVGATTASGAAAGEKVRFGKEDDEHDSMVSVHSATRLQKKANLEIVWQKANSINGIRKMNMLFKEERRQVKALYANDVITPEYLQVCDTFLQMISLKQSENLRMLT